MKKIRCLIAILIIAFPSFVNSAGIGFGTIKGIKYYDMGTKSFQIHFNSDVTKTENDCNVNGVTVAHVTLSKHDAEVVDRMLSIALSAYMSGKKIRAYASGSSCEADFISLQETYF